MTRISVALLVGGDSSERQVSFKSGKALAGALSPERFEVTVFDVASDATRTGDEAARRAAPARAVPVAWSHLPLTLREGGFDVVLLSALHGGWGEDGTLQALLEVSGIPYVGAPPRASTLAMDKQVCKALARELGLAVPRGCTIDDLNDVERAAPFFGAPCVVKPNGGGSSVGVTLLREVEPSSGPSPALRQAVQAALDDGSAALIEELIEGTEITAAVLGQGQAARVLPLIEIVPHSAGGFYDFEAKYAPGGSQHLTPPRLSQAVQERIAADALLIHRALGCRGVARSDFMVSSDGTPYFLEVNTQPGMTETSLVPDAARAAGISFEHLIETLILETLRP